MRARLCAACAGAARGRLAVAGIPGSETRVFATERPFELVIAEDAGKRIVD